MKLAKILLGLGSVFLLSSCATEVPEHKVSECKPKTSSSSNSDASLALKTDVYAQKCAFCHGENGEGGPGGPEFAAKISGGQLALTEFDNIIQNGVGTMGAIAGVSQADSQAMFTAFGGAAGTGDGTGTGTDTTDTAGTDTTTGDESQTTTNDDGTGADTTANTGAPSTSSDATEANDTGDDSNSSTTSSKRKTC